VDEKGEASDGLNVWKKRFSLLKVGECGKVGRNDSLGGRKMHTQVRWRDGNVFWVPERGCLVTEAIVVAKEEV